MTPHELRENAARIIRGFLTANTPAAGAAEFVTGYVKAARDVGAISLAEDQAAEAAVNGRTIPASLRSSIWWGLTV